MLAAKNFQSGMQTLRQIEFSLFDLLLHSDFDPAEERSVLDLLGDVRLSSNNDRVRARGWLLPALRELGFRIEVEPQGAFYLYADVSAFTDDAQAARHARIALDAIIATQGKMHWLCTYATDDRKLFGLVVVESEEVIDA